MAEFRALAQFVVACRSPTLTRAAAELGIALSSLSAAVKALEQELGVSLLARAKSGLYPTAAGFALARITQPLLAAEVFARRRTVASGRRVAGMLTLELGLDFALGHVDLALQDAIARFAARRPDILVDPVWAEEQREGWNGGLAQFWQAAERWRLKLSYAGETASDNGRHGTTLPDPWVMARRMPEARKGNVPDFAAGPLVVPALRPPLRAAALRYFARHGIGRVRFADEQPGELPRLLDEYPDAIVILPRSAVAPRLGLSDVWIHPIVPPLVTRIAAEAPSGPPASFLREFRQALAAARHPDIPRPQISLRQIRYFNLVHRLGRVSAAAQGAKMSQPALSEQLQKLEAIVGIELFSRRGDGVVPTPAGDRLAPVARLIEAGYGHIGAMLPGTAPAKQIAFGILPSVSQHGLLVNRITEAVLSVEARHPALKLVVQEAPNGTLQDWVLRGTVGVAIVETALPHMPRLPLRSSEELAAVVDPRHRLLPAGPVRFADLLRLPLALPSGRSGLRQLLQGAADTRRLKIRPRMEIDALPMVVATLARIPICTVLPPSAIPRELAEGELVAHPIVEPAIARRLFVIYSGDRSLSVPERDLVDMLRTRLAEEHDAE